MPEKTWERSHRQSYLPSRQK